MPAMKTAAQLEGRDLAVPERSAEICAACSASATFADVIPEAFDFAISAYILENRSPRSSLMGQYVAATAVAPEMSQARVSPINPEPGSAAPAPDAHPLILTNPTLVALDAMSADVRKSDAPF